MLPAQPIELILPGTLCRIGTRRFTPYLGSTQTTHPPEDIELFHLVTTFIYSFMALITHYTFSCRDGISQPYPSITTAFTLGRWSASITLKAFVRDALLATNLCSTHCLPT